MGVFDCDNGETVSERVTLELPDNLVQSARFVAAQTHRSVEDVLIAWLDRAAVDVPVELLPDDQVLALRDQQLDAATQNELGDLLAEQREGTLAAEGRVRLQELMNIYRQGMVRKAQALKVAVERGLQPALTSSDGT